MTTSTLPPISVPTLLRLARPSEVRQIQVIEAQSAERFRGMGLIDHVLGEVTAAADLLMAIAGQRVWVVHYDDDVPVGYAVAIIRGEIAYLQEMDVLPAYGRRGLGTQLVEHVCQWARAAGFERLILTTFRDVAWNGPFYSKLGFEYVSRSDWTPAMKEIYIEERDEMQLPWDGRGFYSRRVGADASGWNKPAKEERHSQRFPRVAPR